MAQRNTPGAFERAIEIALKSEVSRIAEEEISAAQERIAKRIRSSMDSLALSILSEYRIWANDHSITIEVRKPEARA